MAVFGTQFFRGSTNSLSFQYLFNVQRKLYVFAIFILFVNGANNESTLHSGETHSVDSNVQPTNSPSKIENEKDLQPNYGVVVVRERSNTSKEKTFCVAQFNGENIASSRKTAVFHRLVDRITSDFCSNVQPENHTSEIIFITYNTSCDVSAKIRQIEKYYNSSGVLISVPTAFSVKKLKIPEKTTVNPQFLIAFISVSSANEIHDIQGDKEVLAFQSIFETSFFDFSLCIIWFIAVITVSIGSYWSGVLRASLYHNKQIECGVVAKKSRRSQSVTKHSTVEEEPYLNVSPIWVLVFVIFMAGMLLALYNFYNYLVYVIIGLFVLASIMSLFSCVDQIAKKTLPTGVLSKNVIICLTNTKTPIYQLFILIIAIALPLFWFFTRKDQHSWILQDILGILFSINMLRTIRLPSFKICFILLCLLFFYDIFFVFITPLITSKGDSVMVEVATGGGKYEGNGEGGKVGEQLPMVLRVPHFTFINDSDATHTCIRAGMSYSLLGFGDILVPGLLVSYCHAFDVIYSTPYKLYYVTTCIFYGLGLIATFIGLYLMHGVAQPALLYLVPFTIIPVVLIALLRKELRKFWFGPGDGSRPDESVEKVDGSSFSNPADANLLINSNSVDQQQENPTQQESANESKE
ncbi:signal peptide peptidase-like 2B [Leptotrombidium deliense]|uniref:Signal peptide peptidase-like 2B n=1 Tax=Leptotrombidium deliense TaxID=299467 RepID=A0A443SA92_9ACAR|nr:signal peptide peptidase-like 2B [Leptotrombidium deliense]